MNPRGVKFVLRVWLDTHFNNDIMKKILLLLAVAVSALAVSARDEVSHDPSVLPEAAQTILKNNFKAKVSFVKIDRDFGRISDYEAILTDGSEVKFDREGNWEEVESSRTSQVPDYFVLAPIRSYLAENHKGARIVGIEKERNGYEVSLSDGIDIKFDKQGSFKKYD